MREIKFRGKGTNSFGWIYGNYVCEDGSEGKPIHLIGLNQGLYEYVDSETIGQYTGLKDKNGKEIYEGDIITSDLEREYLIVEYKNGAFMLNCNDGEDDYYDIFFDTSEDPKKVYKYGEVIGNIYDNPELM